MQDTPETQRIIDLLTQVSGNWLIAYASADKNIDIIRSGGSPFWLKGASVRIDDYVDDLYNNGAEGDGVYE